MRPLFVCRAEKTQLMEHVAGVLSDRGELDQAFAFVPYWDEWRAHLEGSPTFGAVYGTREIYQRMGTDSVDPDELRRIETTYGRDEIWNIAYTESYIAPVGHSSVFNHPKYTDSDVLRYLQFSFQESERILDDCRPDAIVDFAAVGLVRGVLDLVAKHRGIPYYYISSVQLANRFSVVPRLSEGFPRIQEDYLRLAESLSACPDGQEHLRWFRDGTERSIYGLPAAPSSKGISARWKRRLSVVPRIVGALTREVRLRSLARKDPTVRYNFQRFKGVLSIRLYRKYLAMVRLVGLKVRNPFVRLQPTGKYAFMTLHLQPEASTSIGAPFFVNQQAVVENVSRALPLDWRLVVKAHPTMLGREPNSFYRRIARIPNVDLVATSADTRALIVGATAVVAIFGTSGFEALLLGRKTFVFGSPIWSMCRGVTRCTDFTQLHGLLVDAEHYEADNADIAAYLQAVHDNSFAADKNYVWTGPYEMGDEGYREVVMRFTDNLLDAHKDRHPVDPVEA
jgi:hypothetical protein